MRPAAYFAPAVFAQAVRDAEKTAVARGFDLEAHRAAQAKAAKREERRHARQQAALDAHKSEPLDHDPRQA